MTHEKSPRIVGGHLGLDLVNTVAPRTPDVGAHDGGAHDGGEHEDYLAVPADLLLWARRVQVLSDAEARTVAAVWAGSPGADEHALHVVWEIREATYRILAAALAGDGDRVSTLAALDQVFVRWTAALARGSLAPAGVLSAVVRVPAGDPRAEELPGVARIHYGDVSAWLVVDRLAAACVDLLQTVEVRQLKACPLGQGGCGWLFLDRSRNGSRRWCTMDDCGAHAKARRLTERRRASATSKTR